jgi:hypothetical protein
MNQNEIRDNYKHITEELKILQSIGVYNKSKIEELIFKKKKLQEDCQHPNLEEINVDNDKVYICKDCKKIIY